MTPRSTKIRIDRTAPIPIYQQILSEIKARIASGEWPGGTQLPTEAELESDLQVSRVTIRQALSAAAREGVVIRLPGKGTFVSGAPDRLTKTETYIGYVVPHLSSSFNVQILLGAESILREKGYRLIFCNSEGKLAKENELLLSLEADCMAGYLIQPVFSDENDRTLAQIALKGEPIVMIDRGVSGIRANTVTTDHVEGGRKIVQHLIDQGYREIVYLARQPIRLASIAERIHGYKTAMQEAGLVARAPFVFGGPIELGYLQDEKSPTIQERSDIESIVSYLTGPERPEAIVAMNDLVAMLVVQAAKDTGTRIPEDLGLTGFDNLDCAVSHDLTTVEQQPFQIGAEAARLLLQCIDSGKGVMQQKRLPANLIIRGSSRKRG